MGVPHLALALVVSCTAPPVGGARAQDAVQFSLISHHATGRFDAASAEVAAWSPESHTLFVTSAERGLLALDLSDPLHPRERGTWEARGINSVAVHGRLLAVACSPEPDATGVVHLLDLSLRPIVQLGVGFGPDMLTFTRDGRRLVVANEGEPASEESGIDPPGSISVIDLSRGPVHALVREAGFEGFEPDAALLVRDGLHLPRSRTGLAANLEPEYIALDASGQRAFVTLQESNAIAVVDLATPRVRAILPLGTQDFAAEDGGFDPSDWDGICAVRRAPAEALLQPDAIVWFEDGGRDYLATANEGESISSWAWDDSVRLGHAPIDPSASIRWTLADGGSLLAPEALGRLEVSRTASDIDGDGDLDRIVSYGGRSVAIWEYTEGEGDAPAIRRAWDSGSQIEREVLARMAGAFNADSAEGPSPDSRSDNRGPEPEGLTVLRLGARRVLVVGLERAGGVMAWDITDPQRPQFSGYASQRDPATRLPGRRVAESLERAGDLAPEGLCVIPSLWDRGSILAVCNEVSGTVTLLQVRPASD